MHFEVAVIRAMQTLGQATLSEVLETLGAMRGGQPPPVREAPKPKAAPARAARPAPEKPVAKVAEEPNAEPETRNAERAEPHAESETRNAEPATARAKETPPAPEPTADLNAALAAAADATPVFEAAPSPVVEAATAEMNPEQLWARLVQEVRSRRPLIKMWLEIGRLERLEGGAAVLSFPKEQSLAADSIQQPSHRKFLEEVLTEIAGSPLSLKIDIRAPVPVSAALEPLKAPVDPTADFRNDPLIQKALELFKAEIQPA